MHESEKRSSLFDVSAPKGYRRKFNRNKAVEQEAVEEGEARMRGIQMITVLAVAHLLGEPKIVVRGSEK